MLRLLLLFTTSFIAVQNDWTWNAYPESGFKILTPFALNHVVTNVPTEEGVPIIYHQYHGGKVDDSLHISFVIDHYAIPGENIDDDDEYLQEFFGITIDQILKAVEGHLVYMDFMGYSDRKVCVWRATYLNGKGIIRGELIMTGNKYYGLQAFGLADKKPDALMHKFLNSFQTTP